MRKLFRFKYEPCKGDCYAWCDSLPEELNKLSDDDRQLLITMMVRAHDRLCDNPDYSFGIDRDDASGQFVAHFRTPEATDTYLYSSFGAAVVHICGVVLDAKIPQSKGECRYGENGAEELGREILRACLDLVFRKEHHDSCPCQKAVGG